MVLERTSLEKIGKKRRLISLRGILPFLKKGKLLDVGCKFGHVSGYFHSKGYYVEGIDINKGYITRAKKNYKEINFYVKDIVKEIKKKYDTIILIGVLEEINLSPIELLKRLKRNLNAHGRIFIAVRNARALKRRIKSLFGLDPVDPFSPQLWIFTKKRLINVIHEGGYEIIKLTSNKFQSFRWINISTPDNLSEEIFAVIRSKK